MNQRAITQIFVASLAAGCMSSCIHVGKITDEPKLAVSFDSAQAAQVFYDKTYVPDSSGRNSGYLAFGPMLPKFTKSEGSQLRFNKAARAADADGDGTISRSEAEDYAGM